VDKITKSETTGNTALFFELKEFVIAESRAQQRARENDLSRPVPERVARGKCVSRVRFKRQRESGILAFTCPENNSEFREGDQVVLHSGNPFEALASAVWVRDGVSPDGDDFFDLQADSGAIEQILSSKAELFIDAGFLDLSAMLMKGIDEMGATERGRKRILPLLGMEENADAFDPENFAEAADEARDAGFNESQQDAVGMGSSTDWCCLIQGPPGTGKTRVLAQIVRERVDRGERILVTACTHRAIHEALNKIRELNPDLDAIAKIGRRMSDPGLKVAEYEHFRDAPFASETGAVVIGATPFTARSNRLDQMEFDCVIIDEASQMTLPLAILAMLGADTYVVIGDEKQLPPVVVSESPATAAFLGLFQRLSRTCAQTTLNVTYRMNCEICKWVADASYFGELSPHESARDRRLFLAGNASQPWLEQALDPTQSLVWIPSKTITTRHYSMEEADLANQIVKELFDRGFALSNVGILTPFRRQARTIKRRLQAARRWDFADLDALVIDTVERMQGQEREVIIVSTAASDPGFLAAIQDFLYLPARLNVMVSRARVKVIVLASERFLAPERQSEEIEEAIESWHSLRQNCRVVEV